MQDKKYERIGPEWKSLAGASDLVSVVEINNVRYNQLTSSDDEDSVSVFVKEGLEVTSTGNANVELSFTELSDTRMRDVTVALHYKDDDNCIIVGYREGGWYWEFRGNGRVVPFNQTGYGSPSNGSNNHLSISLKYDGQLNGTNNGINIFDTVNVPQDILDSLKDERRIALRLKNVKGNRSRVNLRADNQEEDLSYLYGPKETGPSLSVFDENVKEIYSDNLLVKLDAGFPRVISYHLSDDKILLGQPEKVEVVNINGNDYKPTEVKFLKEESDQLIYQLIFKDKGLDLLINISYKVEGNALYVKVTDVINNNEDLAIDSIGKPKVIRTIDFSNNYLVSVNSSQDGAKFSGTRMSTNTHHSGDIHYDVTNPMRPLDDGFMYAFVNTDKVVAGVWSNSQYTHAGRANDYTRLQVNKKTWGSDNYVGISSSPYIYQNVYRNVVHPEHTWMLPEARVVVGEDLNGDGVVDWQDGAILYRDITHDIVGEDRVRDQVAYRIVMNFGSQAQQPFLSSIDGIRKVNLHTDGLGQALLLKGYGNEGHDSGHLNYKDFGHRIGGLADYFILYDFAKKYGTDIGIHVNATETYPESPYFKDELLRKDENGNYMYGWNWIDQGINIDAAYDLAHDRNQRFIDLNTVVDGKLDFLYVDVWGNNQSGDNLAWATHQLSNEINQQGFAVSYEWGFAGEYDSTWQHWAVDLPYGGYTLKGINSTIARFIHNHRRDSWLADYPTYGGGSNAPLLGGYTLMDFEGWQGRSDYGRYIRVLFEINLPTRFLQHYKVYNWVEGETVKMQDNGESYQWTPEMAVTLRDDNGSIVEIERLSNNPEEEAYRSRVIKLNDRVILNDTGYLLPWRWDAWGYPLNETKHYLYAPGNKSEVSYYEGLVTEENPKVKSSKLESEIVNVSWSLPEELAGKTVYLYELTDQGKVNELVLELDENASFEIKIKTDTPYVIYQARQEQAAMNWQNKHIYDAGFNSRSLEHWNVEGSATVVDSNGLNPMLKIADNKETVTLTQDLTNLKPHTKYAAYVAVDNRSDSKAGIRVKGNGIDVYNYTKRSIAKNYVKANPHNTLEHNATDKDGSYFQNMFVYFTTGIDVDGITLELSKTEGSGESYFDDIRIVENNSNMFDEDHDTNENPIVFEQDFEDVVQGIYPFVVSDVEGVEDNRTHLSQANKEYTRRGWGGKVIADVIEGDWSLKVNGLTEREKLVYQTIPQNFRFEDGVTYKVSFDYEVSTDGIYSLVVGSGEYSSPDELTHYPLSKSTDEKNHGHMTIEVTGDSSGKTWIGIYSTDVEADLREDSGGDANFRGYKDFVLDNLRIKKLS